MSQAYAGIGSRQTPEDILVAMRTIAGQLADLGWTLRTGGAEGADRAFFNAAHSRLSEIELFLPWPGFWQPPYAVNEVLGVRVFERPSHAAYELAARFHPNWRNLRNSVRSLHARNAHQVLGWTLDDPARFVLCWTTGGNGSGGTGQSIRMAQRYGIPVYDLGRPAAWDSVNVLLASQPPQDAQHATRLNTSAFPDLFGYTTSAGLL